MELSRRFVVGAMAGFQGCEMRPVWWRFVVGAPAAAALLVAASCASERAPAALRVRHALVEPAPAGGGADRLLVIGVEGRSVTRLPAGVGRPLASSATLITGPSNEPLAASPSPGERVVLVDTYVELPPAGTSAEFGWVKALPEQRVLVPAGCVAALSIGGSDAGRTLVDLLIQAGETRPLLTLRAERDASEEEEALGTPGPRPVQALRVDWPLDQTDGAFILAVPEAPERGVEGASLWRLSVRQAGAGGPEADEARSLIESIRAAASPSPAAVPWPSMAKALRDANGPEATRAALAFAAVDTGADLAAEAAALAEGPMLAELASGAAGALEQTAPASEVSRVGWSLDRSAILVLAKAHAEGGLSRVMASVLSARYGEVGRDPGALAELARRSGSAAEMARRLEAEHLVLLDDASPALRVRSFDWLASRGAAPAGYDPMGPAKQRRAAVDLHLQSAEVKP